jgi:uncharacterized protein (TIGR00304 family)
LCLNLTTFIKTENQTLSKALGEKGQLTGTEFLYSAGFALILAGIVIIVIVVLLLSIRSAGKGKLKGGGAVIIGPVPIIFGTDKKSLRTILLLSIVLTVLLLVVFIVQYLLLR